MSDIDPTSDVAALTVQLLSAYLSNNTVASDDLADLIRTTRTALTEDTAAAAAPQEPETFTPAVSVRKSLASSEHIISLIDGKRYKTLKRHLASHGLTPESYRARYNLPASYPMVAPDYAAHRRAVAQKIGLGSRKPSATNDAPAAEPQDEAPQQPVTTDAGEAKGGKSTRSAKRSTRSGKTSGGTTSPSSSAAGATDGDGMSSQAAAPAKKASKRKAASKTTPAQSGDDAATVTPANEEGASSNSAPKRRRGKAAAEPSDAQSAVTAEAPKADTKTSAKSTSRKAPAERKKSPRMARPSKSDDAADTGASE